MAETSFPYPPKPWDDGQQVTRENPDGSFTTATYEAARNVWHVENRSAQTLEQVIYTDHVLLTNPVEGTNAAARAELSALLNDGEGSPAITTQEGANQLNIELMNRAILDQRRTQDNVDFLQETISSGLWVRTTGDQLASLPGPTEFHALNSNDQPVYTFAEVERFLFAGEGTGALNQNPDLANTKVGDYLSVQNNSDNEFGVYVVDAIQVVGNPDMGGLWFIQMEVRVVRNKAVGSVEDLDHCTVRTTRPIFIIPSTTTPVVPAEGYVWFKSDTHELYISTRGNTDPEEPGVDQWVKIGPGDGSGGNGGEGVSVGENPPDNPTEGALWFDTVRLELYVYYVEGEDGAWIPTSPLGARVSAGEILQQQILGRVDAIETNYLQLDKANNVTTGFRIKADGSTLISTSGNELGLYHVKDPTSGNDEWAATKGYVDTEIAKVDGGGGSFQTKYDGNRVCVANATSVTSLSTGEVIYLSQQLVSTTQPALVEAIGLPLDEFNWASCIKSGVIKVNNGAFEAGYYQVFKTKESPGRNMIVYVKPIWFDSDQSLQAGGTPCYFQGVFFE